MASALATLLTTFSTATLAADLLVITDSHHPIKPIGGERIIELDQPARIEADLSANLPTDPSQAAALAHQRLDGDLQRRMAHAYQGIADAWGLGIAKIPAVVVDRRFVIYGEPDVAHAIARINVHRSAQP
jgi:integrating conjugative element protein (TIGR03757 family)